MSTTTDTDRTLEIIRKVRQLEIHTRHLVTEAVAGAYHSSFKGQGIDFEEVREYMVGDDVRSIDWNVTAKMDRPFIKVFREERELSLMLLVDLSASGDFSSHEESRREIAAEIASVLAFTALKNNDKVGLILFTDQIEKFVAPKKGKQHILRLIREILFFKPKGRGTNIPAALNHLNRVIKRKAVTFLISDFLQDTVLQTRRKTQNKSNDTLMQTIALSNRRHDLNCIVLTDPRELELPDIGHITVEDAESGELLEVNTRSAKVRKHYKRYNKERLEFLEKALKRCKTDALFLSIDQPYFKPLRRFLEQRAARR